jgi:hypothetical protein
MSRAAHVSATGDRIAVTLDRDRPAGNDLLVLSEMYRPDWVAASGHQSLAVTPFLGSLLAVALPDGANEVTFSYEPWPLIVATIVAWGALGVTAAVVLVLWRVDRRRSVE